MKKPVHTLAAAMVTAILSLSAATAQGNGVQGEVRKIDEAAGKITLKHGPIKNLGMDVGMTMIFRVKDPAMLKQVQGRRQGRVRGGARRIGIHGDEAAEEQLTDETVGWAKRKRAHHPLRSAMVGTALGAFAQPTIAKAPNPPISTLRREVVGWVERK